LTKPLRKSLSEHFGIVTYAYHEVEAATERIAEKKNDTILYAA